MTDATSRALNQLNRSLYVDRAAEWDAARRRPWRGFARLCAELARTGGGGPLRALDVGCGNGRLAAALAEACEAQARTLDYVGVDASEPLLELARGRAPRGARFACVDFILNAPADALPPGPFACVTLIGVLHVVPGAARRRALLEATRERVAPGGLLALTRWCFAEHPERRTRIVPWPSDEARALAIDPAEIEPGDHLLRFGARGALRYAHATSPEELDAALAPLALARVAEWYDDGPDGRENHYLVLRVAGA